MFFAFIRLKNSGSSTLQVKMQLHLQVLLVRRTISSQPRLRKSQDSATEHGRLQYSVAYHLTQQHEEMMNNEIKEEGICEDINI